MRAKVSIPAAVLVPRALRIAEHDTDPLRRAAALRGLARVAPAQALSIARACRSSNATERGAAWLVRAAAGEDASTWFGPQVNVHTLTLLADCKAWPTLSVLLPGWMRDPEPDLAQRAVRLAAHVDDPGPRLLALVDSPHDEVRVAVLETLLSLRLPQAEDAALEVLKTRPPPEVAFAAVRALAERGTVRAVAPLLAYADEPGVVGQRDTDARDAVSRIQSRLGPVEAGRVSVAAGGEVSIAGGVEVSLAKRRT